MITISIPNVVVIMADVSNLPGDCAVLDLIMKRRVLVRGGFGEALERVTIDMPADYAQAIADAVKRVDGARADAKLNGDPQMLMGLRTP